MNQKEVAHYEEQYELSEDSVELNLASEEEKMDEESLMLFVAKDELNNVDPADVLAAQLEGVAIAAGTFISMAEDPE